MPAELLGIALLLLSLIGGFAAVWIFAYKPHHLLVWLALAAACFFLLGWPGILGIAAALAIKWKVTEDKKDSKRGKKKNYKK